MRDLILLPVCMVSWGITIIKLRSFFVKKTVWQAKQGMARTLWSMLFFFSITITFMIGAIASPFDAHTFPNLSVLITHYAFLTSEYFTLITILTAIGVPTNQRTRQWIKILFGLEFIVLFVIYLFFLSKTPGTLSESPENFQMVIFKFSSYPFGIFLCWFVTQAVLKYLPSHEFALLRLRAIIVVLTTSTAGLYIFVRMLIYASFFLTDPYLESWLSGVSSVFLFLSAFFFFMALLSNKIYARLLMMSKSMDAWHAFQDLKYLTEQLLQICPVVGLPVGTPSFWVFLLNPEYHLYRAAISILDSRVLLADFLAEEKSFVREATQLDKAIRIHRALQAANPSNDFTDIVDTYRRVSRDVLASQI